jgi:hypothetical protein
MFPGCVAVLHGPVGVLRGGVRTWTAASQGVAAGFAEQRRPEGLRARGMGEREGVTGPAGDQGERGGEGTGAGFRVVSTPPGSARNVKG